MAKVATLKTVWNINSFALSPSTTTVLVSQSKTSSSQISREMTTCPKPPRSAWSLEEGVITSWSFFTLSFKQASSHLIPQLPTPHPKHSLLPQPLAPTLINLWKLAARCWRSCKGTGDKVPLDFKKKKKKKKKKNKKKELRLKNVHEESWATSVKWKTNPPTLQQLILSHCAWFRG